jgi:hypothetical protein
MDSNSFQKRFKNRTQFISKEGNISLGTYHVPKVDLSPNKLHIDSVLNRTGVIKPIKSITKTPSAPDIYSNVNKSYTNIKLPKISRNIEIKTDNFEANLAHFKTSYSLKKKKLTSITNLKQPKDIISKIIKQKV